MRNSKPLVIVLSRNYSTGLGVIRSLGEAGYTVDLIASTKKAGRSIIASCSKYIRNAKEVLSPKIQEDSGEELIEALLSYAQNEIEDKMIIFPTDDFTASVVDAHRDRLKPFFLFPGTTVEGELSITELMDKTVQGKTARGKGLLTPKEWIISLRDDIDLPQDMQYPCFVKPLQSVSGHKTEMAVCDNPNILMIHLKKMQDFHRERSVLVQEFLDIEKEYDISGVCLDQEIILPAVIEKTRTAMYERGVAVAGRIHRPDILGPMVDQIKDMLREFHYIGMFDIDLHYSGGNFYFSEINFRSGGLSFSYFLNGVNLPAIFVKGITGETIDTEETKMKVFGKTFVYEKVAWEDYIYNYISKKELDHCISEADYTLLNYVNDPEPGKCFNQRIRLSALKQKTKQNINKLKSKRVSSPEIRNAEIVVTGRNYCNILTMTRGLGKAGYQVDVLRVFKTKPKKVNLMAQMKPDACSKYVNRFVECIVNNDPKRVVEQLIKLANPSRKKLLIPVDDYLAHVVDENMHVLEPYYLMPNINGKEGEICRLMDKNEQKKLAESFSLPMLQSTLIKSQNGQFTIPEDVHYPCFIKPNVSMKSTKAMMMKCDNKAALIKALQSFAKKDDIEVLVEEFADIKHEYSILGLSTADGAVSPGMFRAIEGGHKERKGVAITGETVPCSMFSAIINECNRFIASLNYTGLFDVDLIETKDGRVYFVELNFRAGASAHVFTESGVNLPGMFADYMLKGKAVDLQCEVKDTGKRFISEKVLLEEFARSDTNIKKMRKNLTEADVCFIKDCQDMKPYQNFKRYYFVAGLMQLPYKIRDRRKKS